VIEGFLEKNFFYHICPTFCHINTGNMICVKLFHIGNILLREEAKEEEEIMLKKMKRMKERILSIVLTLTMVVSLLAGMPPMEVSAAENVYLTENT